MWYVTPKRREKTKRGVKKSEGLHHSTTWTSDGWVVQWCHVDEMASRITRLPVGLHKSQCIRPSELPNLQLRCDSFDYRLKSLPCDWRSTHRVSARFVQNFWSFRRWHTNIYRVSHELRSLLRESVPYVKIYRYNPKHLCPKLNGYGDNGKRKVCTSWGCTHYTCQLAVIYVRPCVGCHVTECAVSHVSQASHVTSAFSIPVSCIVLRTIRITMTRVRMFL